MIVQNLNFLDNNLPDKCANLIIADPPYFEVKGSFDFIWKSFDDYLLDVEKWAIECKRILADNGTLLWWGHAKKIAYAQVILDKYFNLENSIVWEKYDSQVKKGIESYRCFAPITERILMYSNEIGMSALKKINHTMELWEPIVSKLNKNIKSKKQCIDLLREDGRYTSEESLKVQTGVKFGWGNRFEFLDEKMFDMCKKELKFDFSYQEIKHEYTTLKSKYLETARPFDNFQKLNDVMRFSQEAHLTGKYKHDTCKPETLTRTLIRTCSRPNDLVVVPFAGSGTECAMAIKEGRKAIGFDIEKKYVDMANKRCESILMKPELFV